LKCRATEVIRFHMSDQPTPLHFVPKGGDVLMVDFGPDPLDPETFPLARGPVGVAPEMIKTRRAVVLGSPSPGIAIVAPLSRTRPNPIRPFHVEFAEESYPFLKGPCWLKGDLVQSVSLGRVDRVRYWGRHRRARLSEVDFRRVRQAVLEAVGMGRLVDYLP
jgi:uncharacterized protein YifN (PemK superfamily)